MLLLPVPRFRADCRGASDTALVDNQALELAPDARQIFELLDGQRRFPELIAELHELGSQVSVDDALTIIRQAAQLELLEPPDWEQLPLLVLDNARFSCRSAGDCCRVHEIGPLAADDLKRLAAHGLSSSLVQVESEEGTQHFMKKHGDACVFFDTQTSQCRLHEQHGAEAKPRLCQVFPARITFLPGALRVSLGPGCSCRYLSRLDGQPLEEQTAGLLELFRPELLHQSPFGVWTLYLPAEAEVPLTAEMRLTFERFRELEGALLAEVSDRKWSIEQALEAGLQRAFALTQETPPELGRVERAAGLTVLLHFCQLVLDRAAVDAGSALHKAVVRLKDHVLKDPAESLPEDLGMATEPVQDLARDFLRNELWTLHPLSLGRPYLAGLVLLAYSYVLSKWLALEFAIEAGAAIDEACFSRAFQQIANLLENLQLDDSAGLLPFAAAPDLAPGGLAQYCAL